MDHYFKRHPFIVSILLISVIVPLLSLISENLTILLIVMNPIVFIFVWGPLHLSPVAAAIAASVANYVSYLIIIAIFNGIINAFKPKSKKTVASPASDNITNELSTSKPKAPSENWIGVIIAIVGIVLLALLSFKLLLGWAGSTL